MNPERTSLTRIFEGWEGYNTSLVHDMHHGGELSQMLETQGIEAFELSALGGHILLPPVFEEP